jgi:thiamine pyrophosphokinase
MIGDLDSAAPEDIAQLQRERIQVIRYPREKNETDLELAMRQATASGAKQILIVGALGGRLDQTLGNIFLLSDPDLLGIDVRLENGNEEVFLIRSQAMISGQPGDIVSLLPIEGPAQGVETQGLEYPLRSETLYPFRTRGISNVMTTQQAQVSLASGLLVCIHTRGSK